MNEADIAYFRELLNSWLKDLKERAVNTISELKTAQDFLPDIVDQASFDLNRNFTLRIRDRERHLERKINEALERIEEGTFGICEMCGDDIAIPRLQARPVTTYCINCKTRMEANERRQNAAMDY